MVKILYLAILLSIATTNGKSQKLTNEALGIIHFKDRSYQELLGKLKSSGEDTTRVNTLIRICSYFWDYSHSYDSILYFAHEARLLSKSLNYELGYNEGCFLECKMLAKKGAVKKAEEFIPLVAKPQQIRLLLVLGEHYLFLPGAQKEDLDSAYYYFNRGLLLSKALNNHHWEEESLVALGKYYFSAGEFYKGKNSFLEVIGYYQKNGDKRSQARWWNDLGLYMPDTDSTFSEELSCFKNAINLFAELNDTLNEASVMKDVALRDRFHSRYDSAINILNKAIKLLKAAGIKNISEYAYYLGAIYRLKGDLDESLFYTMETLKNLKEIGDTGNIVFVDYELGEIYAALNQPETSLKYYLEAKDRMDDWSTYSVYAKAAGQMLLLNRPLKALKFLKDLQKAHPPLRPADKETMAGALGDCYYSLHQNGLAEKQYLEMIALDKKVQGNKGRDLEVGRSISGPEAYYMIGKFYLEQKKYVLANSYIEQSLHKRSFENNISYSVNLLRNIKWIQFKADSSLGNYFSALQNYQIYKKIDDSLFNSDRIKKLEKLQVAYETKEKENNIELLQKKDLIQQTNLGKANLLNDVAVGGVLLLLTIVGLLIWQYRQKRRSNKLITSKNEMLEHLLTEKEWLLKEVHHRVKNNLHTVICLLESQAEYLEDDALKAIENSQHRIYAMSLIHQELYQLDDVKTIDMVSISS